MWKAAESTLHRCAIFLLASPAIRATTTRRRSITGDSVQGWGGRGGREQWRRRRGAAATEMVVMPSRRTSPHDDSTRLHICPSPSQADGYASRAKTCSGDSSVRRQNVSMQKPSHSTAIVLHRARSVSVEPSLLTGSSSAGSSMLHDPSSCH